MVLGGTIGARAVILDDPQIDHFFTCLGYIFHDQQAHHDQCWPYNGPSSNDTLAPGSFVPGTLPTTTTTPTMTTTTTTTTTTVPTTTTTVVTTTDREECDDGRFYVELPGGEGVCVYGV